MAPYRPKRNWRKIKCSFDAVLEIENLEGKHFFFAGSIRVTGSIAISGFLQAGWGIEAGWGIGIFAGLSVKLDKWSLYAKVIAKTKPENLISGFWAGKKALKINE